ncbi:MAG: terminase small subunit [Myxococcota bacterium]
MAKLNKTKTLTEKQRRFVEAYLGEACGNATEAARQAGFAGSRTTLQQVGHENLRKPHIRDAIDERTESDAFVLTREGRQRFWSQVMNDPNVEMRHRLRASELLGRSQGDFVDRSSESDRNAEAQIVVFEYPDNGRGPPDTRVTRRAKRRGLSMRTSKRQE